MIRPSEIRDTFGDIDIYLFDQLQRGRLGTGTRLLDAGCGFGRNLTFFLRAGYQVFGTDRDPRAIDLVRNMAATLAPSLPSDNFRVEPIEQCSFAADSFDAVVSSAVLHFAHDETHFNAMIDEMWRVLRRGGLLFCRLASTIGMADRMQPLGGRRFLLPDGSERFLADVELLEGLARRLSATLIDPIKTTVVQDQRCMTTWVVTKPG
jgi:tellurite methyltransferase